MCTELPPAYQSKLEVTYSRRVIRDLLLRREVYDEAISRYHSIATNYTHINSLQFIYAIKINRHLHAHRTYSDSEWHCFASE